MDTHIIKTAPEAVFPHGIVTVFASEEEAMRQACWDIGGGGQIEGVWRVPGGRHWDFDDTISPQALTNAWAAGETITPGHVPYKLTDRASKLYSTSALEKKSNKVRQQIIEEEAIGTLELLLSLHTDMKLTRLEKIIDDLRRIENAVPGNAYSVLSGGTATGGAIALGAATAKTVLMLIAATANQPALVETAISFDGVTASAVPVLCEWVSSTQATAGTTTAQTPKQIRGWPGQGSQTTAAVNYTAEPTVLEAYKKRLLTPNGGLIVIQQPMGREPTGQVTAATQFKGLGYRLTAPAAVNCHIDAEFEE